MSSSRSDFSLKSLNHISFNQGRCFGNVTEEAVFTGPILRFPSTSNPIHSNRRHLRRQWKPTTVEHCDRTTIHRLHSPLQLEE
jgi:hypothetical protein